MELCDWVYRDQYFGGRAVALWGADVEGDSWDLYDFDRVYGAGDTGGGIGAIIWAEGGNKWKEID
jgi:hypothetical protein